VSGESKHVGDSDWIISDRVEHGSALGDLATLQLTSPSATATVTLQGAHLTHFGLNNAPPVLWVSGESHFEVGRAIRGGIPICWPWFADQTEQVDVPMHGVARTSLWEPIRSHADATSTTLSLGLSDSPDTQALWPHRFEFEYTIRLSDCLEIELLHRNIDSDAVTCSGALHTYFSIDDLAKVRVEGLEGLTYIDKVDEKRRHLQEGPIQIAGETDRIYLETKDPVTLHDGKRRSIYIDSSGSRSMVVWNPWVAKAAAMADFADDEYTQMICVETANAGEDVVQIHPGREHRLGCRIRVL
jgi:glucose-6-phosphate 1-epimerase